MSVAGLCSNSAVLSGGVAVFVRRHVPDLERHSLMCEFLVGAEQSSPVSLEIKHTCLELWYMDITSWGGVIFKFFFCLTSGVSFSWKCEICLVLGMFYWIHWRARSFLPAHISNAFLSLSTWVLDCVLIISFQPCFVFTFLIFLVLLASQ